jgi:hypothetical protein
VDTESKQQGAEAPHDILKVNLDQVLFKFNYTFEKKDWRMAADSAETLEAFRRILRVPIAIVLAILMVGGILPLIAGVIKSFSEEGPEKVKKLGSMLKIVFRPIWQDRMFRRHIRRGTPVVLEMTGRGMTIVFGSKRVTVEWYQIEYAIDSSDGLLLESNVSGPIWIPVRAFSDWEEQKKVHRFVKRLGVEHRTYGSG